MGDDNNAVTLRDAQFLDNRIVEVKHDLIAEMKGLQDQLRVIDARMFNLNREVGGLKGKMQLISGIVGACSGLITALATKFGLH